MCFTNSSLGADSKIMITDFGLSSYKYSDEAMRTTCGTPEYIAPGKVLGYIAPGTRVPPAKGQGPYRDVARLGPKQCFKISLSAKIVSKLSRNWIFWGIKM